MLNRSTVRAAVGIFIAFPLTLLAMFAAWLFIASVLQIAYGHVFIGIVSCSVSTGGLIGYVSLWSYVIFGIARGNARRLQGIGIGLGFVSFLLFMIIQAVGMLIAFQNGDGV